MEDTILLEDLIEYVKKNYNASDCGLTERCSHSSSSDVFSDGERCGEAWALYFLAGAFGFSDRLKVPEEPDETC